MSAYYWIVLIKGIIFRKKKKKNEKKPQKQTPSCLYDDGVGKARIF